MLVLHRKRGEAILIGDNIRVVVVSRTDRGMRIGIEAPAGIEVVREEIKRMEVREDKGAAPNTDG